MGNTNETNMENKQMKKLKITIEQRDYLELIARTIPRHYKCFEFHSKVVGNLVDGTEMVHYLVIKNKEQFARNIANAKRVFTTLNRKFNLGVK